MLGRTKGLQKKPTYSSSPEAQAVAKKVTHFKEYPDIKRAALMATAFYLDHEKIELLQANFTAMDKVRLALALALARRVVLGRLGGRLGGFPRGAWWWFGLVGFGVGWVQSARPQWALV